MLLAAGLLDYPPTAMVLSSWGAEERLVTCLAALGCTAPRFPRHCSLYSIYIFIYNLYLYIYIFILYKVYLRIFNHIGLLKFFFPIVNKRRIMQ